MNDEMSNKDLLERWCDRRGLVMKDFPDRMVSEAWRTGDFAPLDEWLETHRPRTEVLMERGLL